MQRVSLCSLYILPQTRLRSEPAAAVRKLPKDGASHASMTLVPAAGKGLLIEYTSCTIRNRQEVFAVIKNRKQMIEKGVV